MNSDLAQTFKQWHPSAQEKAIQMLQEATARPWRPFYCPRPTCDGEPHGPVNGGQPWNFRHARTKQRPPRGDWLVWLLLGGRGSGKTRGGSEYIQRATKKFGRIALISPTGPDVRDVLVEGESGILATSPPGAMPTWEPSKRKLTWPNGATAYAYSAEEPDRLRGPQFHAAWLDEPCHYEDVQAVWDNLLLGLRLGTHPKIVCTTTPLPIPWLKALVKREDTVHVNMPTYDNLANLPPTFRQAILSRYEGTRKGQQELMGEIIADVEGALWEWDFLHHLEEDVDLDDLDLDRVVVAIDPAGTSNARSDETGIVVLGSVGSQFVVLEDRSGRYKPNVWAGIAVEAALAWGGDIVAERNYGGEMVEQTLRNAFETVPVRVRTVQSRRGKVIRAEPVVALYERGMVTHARGLTELEDQLLSWVPGDKSPDRLDALVHGLTDLARNVAPATIMSPTDLNLRLPTMGARAI